MRHKKHRDAPHCVIAFDQSYQRTGVCVMKNRSELIYSNALEFKNCKTPKEKRASLRTVVEALCAKFSPDFIIVERVRMYSQGFVSMKTIISLSSLITAIVDASPVPVYSVDTKAWKRRVLGDTKMRKEDAVNFVLEEYSLATNDDIADALCIARAAFFEDIPLQVET